MASIGIELKFNRAIRDWAYEAIKIKEEQVIVGKPPDYAIYREAVGYMKALNSVLEQCERIEKELTGA